MFTGIIETLGTVQTVERQGQNRVFSVESPLSGHLKIDQSLAHDGVCLTVVGIGDGTHTVVAVAETLARSTLGAWQPGTRVNLERCLAVGGRLDGHLVQGHVDAVGTCLSIQEMGGSWQITFAYPPEQGNLLVDKGSVCLNGVSLTVVGPTAEQFSVAVIPYTWEHTNFHALRPGDQVNLEFDIIGKYIARGLAAYQTTPAKGNAA